MAVLLAGALLLQSLSSDGSPEALATDAEIVEAPVAAVTLSPRQYLFATYPSIAPRLACVIQKESRWDPGAQNPRSGAAGLTQMLLSTWLTTPPGRRGERRFNAYSNLDGAAWLVSYGGGWRHWAATIGGC